RQPALAGKLLAPSGGRRLFGDARRADRAARPGRARPGHGRRPPRRPGPCLFYEGGGRMMRQSDRLGLVMQQAQLANGLKIYYIPRPGFSKTFAMLATDFGSVDASFTLDGVRYDMPAGVAHFLEHKMFEDA